jgi:apolipoprotein N-acyltransferase
MVQERKWTGRLGRMALVGLSGASLSLAFPGANWAWLAWVALLPLMVVLWSGGKSHRKRRGLGYGWLFGCGFFLCNLSWLSTVSGLGQLILASYLALFPALWGCVVSRWMNPWESQQARSGRFADAGHALLHAAAQASLWAGLEWLRGWLFTGFGWNGLGVAMHEQPVLAQWADLFGVSGLSWVMVFVPSVLLQVGRRMMADARVGRRRSHPDFLLALSLLAGVFVYGVWCLAREAKLETFPLKVCLVQCAVPQVASRQLWSAEEIHLAYEEEVEQAMAAVEHSNHQALERAVEKGEGEDLFYPDWLVLPEVALTGRLMSTPEGDFAFWRETEESLEKFRQVADWSILLGMAELEGQSEQGMITITENPRAWNSLVALDPEGGMQRYQKKHLVMFGEYIPLIEQLPWLKSIYEQQAGVRFEGAFDVGQSIEPLPMSVRGKSFSVIPSICFEDTVPREARAFVRQEPQVLVNVTNDGWFGYSAAAAQHFANAKFRAIELRRPLVRSANMGLCAVVSTTGHAQKLLDDKGQPFVRGHLLATAKVPLKPTSTLYQQYGDWPIIIAGLLSLMMTWPSFLRSKNR